jgi:hypothetical protein
MTSRAITVLGIIWGLVDFLFGLASSFTLNGNDFVAWLLALFLGFLAVLPVAILAAWSPTTSAALLLVCVVVVECVGFAVGGFRRAAGMGLTLALPDIVLICGYVYVGRARRKTAQ